MLALAREFVCAADEVWRLQRGSEADCVFFQRMVNGGERITDRGSRQGTWLCTASGELLGRFNTRNVDRVVEVLERALETWRGLPESKHELPESAQFEPAHRWESNYPSDGLVLERIAREAPDGAPRGERVARWNRDFAWFAREEVHACVPAATPEVGATWDLAPLARRLARFHLVDNVNGQTLPYAEGEVLAAELSARVRAVEGSVVELELSGRTSADSTGTWLLGDNLWKPKGEWPHSIRCELLGRARFDTERGAFADFELVAVGERRGRTQFNGRRNDSEGSSVAFHLQLGNEAHRVAPTFIALYGADWLVAPEVPTWFTSPAECGLSEE